MNIQIEIQRLIKSLSQVIGVVEKRQTLPILGNILLNQSNGLLTLVGTDLETEITTQIDNVSGQDGAATVSARKLYDICRSLPEDAQIKLELGSDGKMKVNAGKSQFTLQTLPADNFPKLETSDWDYEFSISEPNLSGLFARTSFAMAQQDVRYFLNGLLLEINTGKLRAVATDGHRLARSEIDIQGVEADRVQRILPRKAVLEMTRFLSDDEDQSAKIDINPGHIRVRSGNLIFISKLIDGRFPDYEKVIPNNLSRHLNVPRQALIEILSRVAILSNEKFRGVSITLENGVLRVSSHNPDQEEASDEMPIDYQGETVEIGFNVGYLLEALKVLSSNDVDFGLQDPNTSCTVNAPDDEDTLYLIMPMRL